MFCKSCGNELKEGAKVCDKCGAKNPELDGNAVKNNVSVENGKQPRDAYIGKSYVFDYYVGVNLRSFRISRRAVGFNEDHLLYCKGLRKTQIPYSAISKIEDTTKISAYVIFCIAVFLLIGIICIVCGAAGYSLIAFALAVLSFFFVKCREISIVTTDNKAFKIKVVKKNKEIDEFLTSLRSETGIR